MNIITFDIEDWFHVTFEKEYNDEIRWEKFESRIERNTENILEILADNNINATFFILGWVARKHPGLVRKIHKSGHDIGSHSDIHNLASKLNRLDFVSDLKKSMQSIEDTTGEKLKIFRAPAFSIGQDNLWALEALLENGIEFDCSVFPAKRDFGGFPEIATSNPFRFKIENSHIKEFPISTYSILNKRLILTGGGYFRFFPYSTIKRCIKASKYNMTYFHPRDFDPNQPTLRNLSAIRRFKSYYGLKHSLDKFKMLIKDFDFVSVSEADSLCTWDKLKTYNIEKGKLIDAKE